MNEKIITLKNLKILIEHFKEKINEKADKSHFHSLENIRSDAEIKENPAIGDYIPVIDMADGGQMKKMPYVVPPSGAGEQYSKPNLLDNPDFKVNQRGLSLYTQGGHCVDRWYFDSSCTTVTVTDYGIRVSVTDSYLSYFLRQRFEVPFSSFVSETGKTLTLTVKFRPSRIDLPLILMETAVPLASTDWQTFTVEVPEDYLDMEDIELFSSADGLQEGDWLDIAWVKLEEGTIATPFIPPNYSMELLKCQRYYEVVVPASTIYNFPGFFSGEYRDDAPLYFFTVPMHGPKFNGMPYLSGFSSDNNCRVLAQDLSNGNILTVYPQFSVLIRNWSNMGLVLEVTINDFDSIDENGTVCPYIFFNVYNGSEPLALVSEIE